MTVSININEGIILNAIEVEWNIAMKFSDMRAWKEVNDQLMGMWSMILFATPANDLGDYQEIRETVKLLKDIAFERYLAAEA